MGERAVTEVVPVIAFTEILRDVTGTTAYPNGNIATSATVPNGAFGSRSSDFSKDFAHGWLHVLAILDVTGGTPSFEVTIFGRARARVPSTEGSNTPTYIEWAPIRRLNNGLAVSAANNPESVASATRLVYQEPIQVCGASGEYMAWVTAIGGTSPTLDLYMAFSRG